MSNEKGGTAHSFAQAYLQTFKHVYRREKHYVWYGNRYFHVEDRMIERMISEFISSLFPKFATARMVDEVVRTVAQMSAVPNSTTEPFWLDHRPQDNIAVFENGVVNIDHLIQEQLREPYRITTT